MIATLICAIVSVICANSTKVTAPVHSVLIGAIAFSFAGLGWEKLGVSSIAFLTGLAAFHAVRFIHKRFKRS